MEGERCTIIGYHGGCGKRHDAPQSGELGTGSQEAAPGVARRRGHNPPDESGKRAGAAQERGDATSAPTPVNPSESREVGTSPVAADEAKAGSDGQDLLTPRVERGAAPSKGEADLDRRARVTRMGSERLTRQETSEAHEDIRRGTSGCGPEAGVVGDAYHSKEGSHHRGEVGMNGGDGTASTGHNGERPRGKSLLQDEPGRPVSPARHSSKPMPGFEEALMGKPFRRDHFESFIYKTEHCWFWLGHRDEKGYGIYGRREARRKAHRIAYQLAQGVWLTSEELVLHHCDVPMCVRPDHLYVGTDADNARDRTERGRTLARENQPRHKLTEAQVAEIRRTAAIERTNRSHPFSATALGKKFGVSGQTILRVVHGQSWRENSP